MTKTQMLTVKQLAERLECSQQWALTLIRKHKIDHTYLNPRLIVVPESAVATLQQVRQQKANKAKENDSE